MLKRVFSFFIATALCASMCATAVFSSADADEGITDGQTNFSVSDVSDISAENSAKTSYNGPYIEVGSAVLPLADHMPGTFFSKNGQICSCHNTADCISSGADCNCIRFYPTGNAEDCEIDLLATQCFGFSRLVFYKCFGFIDAPINSSKYHSVGSLAYGNVTESSVKALLSKAAPGAHIRLSKGHSASILSMSESGIIIYHANAGGDNIIEQSCVVSTRTFTWAEFAQYAYLGINYVNMPNDYPGYSNTDAPETVYPEDPEYAIGKYELTDNLNLRTQPNTSSNIVLTIPSKTIVEVTEINGDWGKTSYNGNDGWIALWYTSYLDSNDDKNESTDSKNTFVIGEDGFLRAIADSISFDDFSKWFEGGIEIFDIQGEAITSGIIKTGHTIKFSDGKTAIICLAGDVTLDGIVDADDYMLAKRAFFGTSNPSKIAREACDIAGEDGVDAEDYIALKRFYFSNDRAIFSEFLN